MVKKAMVKQQQQGIKWNLSPIVILSWFALVAQFYLIIKNRIAPIPETIIRYFSFYTILTNLLVAVCFSFLLAKPKSVWGIFFSKSGVIAAITVYITIVGLVYALISSLIFLLWFLLFYLPFLICLYFSDGS